MSVMCIYIEEFPSSQNDDSKKPNNYMRRDMIIGVGPCNLPRQPNAQRGQVLRAECYVLARLDRLYQAKPGTSPKGEYRTQTAYFVVTNIYFSAFNY